jgi:hypothetical protein
MPAGPAPAINRSTSRSLRIALGPFLFPRVSMERRITFGNDAFAEQLLPACNGGSDMP